jgi:hypothetical protein
MQSKIALATVFAGKPTVPGVIRYLRKRTSQDDLRPVNRKDCPGFDPGQELPTFLFRPLSCATRFEFVTLLSVARRHDGERQR